MNDPRLDGFMHNVRKWLEMPVEQARADIMNLMRDGFQDEFGYQVDYAELDYKLAACCETTEEIIGAVFGI